MDFDIKILYKNERRKKYLVSEKDYFYVDVFFNKDIDIKKLKIEFVEYDEFQHFPTFEQKYSNRCLKLKFKCCSSFCFDLIIRCSTLEGEEENAQRVLFCNELAFNYLINFNKELPIFYTLESCCTISLKWEQLQMATVNKIKLFLTLSSLFDLTMEAFDFIIKGKKNYYKKFTKNEFKMFETKYLDTFDIEIEVELDLLKLDYTLDFYLNKEKKILKLHELNLRTLEHYEIESVDIFN